VGYPENPKPQSAWAQRMMKAHDNAVENLVVFAALVLAAHALGVSDGATATACVVYFWARIVHLGAPLDAVGPHARFAVGFFAQRASPGRFSRNSRRSRRTRGDR
jgi:hypothetical protein